MSSLNDVQEIQQDILDAFLDVGTIDEKVNIYWWKRVHADFDTTTQQSTDKNYVEYEMNGLVTSNVTMDEKTLLGLDDRTVLKFYVVGIEFDNYGFQPNDADRVNWNGIVFEVKKIKPIMLADKALLFAIFIQEAEFAVQEEGYREEVDPNFEPDKSQAIDETDTTGVNINIYELFPAIVVGNEIEDFIISAGSNDTILMRLNDLQKTIVIDPGILTAAEIVTDLKAKLDAAYGPKQVDAFEQDGTVSLRSFRIGTDEDVEIETVDNSIYADLGWKIGTVTGYKKLKQEESAAYEDGDPLYDNG